MKEAPKKLKVGRPSNQQKVTGVIVNKKLNAPKKLIRKIRQQLYYCGRYGIKSHCEREGLTEPEFLNYINGMLGHIRLMQPAVADELKVQLNKIQKNISFDTLADEESKLLAFRHAIEEEKKVSFAYDGQFVRAAPAEIFMEEDGIKIIRAFQIFPQLMWKRFHLLSIQSLKVEGP